MIPHLLCCGRGHQWNRTSFGSVAERVRGLYAADLHRLVTDNLLQIATVSFIVLNLAGFVAMGLDKHLAVTGGRRIPEARLFTLALFGGAIGTYLGMNYFRHKTRHVSFRLGLPAMICLHAGVAYTILMR